MIRITRGSATLAIALLSACADKPGESDQSERDTTVTNAPAAPTPAPSAPVSAASSDTTQWVLRADGIGPLRVGMTVAEADRAVGGLDRTAGLEACDYVRPKRGPAGVSFMVEEGRIARVDVGDSARVMTVAGIRPGESETAARQAYPQARVQPHKYDDRGHYLVVLPAAPADTLHRIVFETDGRVVTTMRGGLYPAVEYVEGCS